MTRDSTRTARLTPEVLAVVKRAAELQGRSVSDFVVAAAQEAAYRTLEETSVIRLSIEDQQRFVDLLLNPRASTPALQRAAQAHAALISKASDGPVRHRGPSRGTRQDRVRERR